MSTAATEPAATRDVTAMPAPLHQRHDKDDRLIAASFESAGAALMAGAAAEACWLVALDGSDNALHALAAAARMTKAAGLRCVDLVNVQPWMSKEAAQTELLQCGWRCTAAARDGLQAQGLAWRLHVAMGEAAPRIVEQAETLGSVAIAIGARGLSATEGLLLGSIVQQVLHRSRGAVLVVR